MSAPVNREALIELIAKADDGVDIDKAWDECGEEMRRAYTEHAAVILAAIEAAGCAVVPVVPTQEMTRADDAVTCNADPYAPLTGETWRAMLAASPYRKEPTP